MTSAAERLNSNAFLTGAVQPGSAPREGRPATIEAFGRVLAELVGQAAERREGQRGTRDADDRAPVPRDEPFGRRVAARWDRDTQGEIERREPIDDTDDTDDAGPGRCDTAEPAAAGAAVHAAGCPSPQESERAREVSARSTGSDLEVGRNVGSTGPEVAAVAGPVAGAGVGTAVGSFVGTVADNTLDGAPSGPGVDNAGPLVTPASVVGLGGAATTLFGGETGGVTSTGAAVGQDPDLASVPGVIPPAGPPPGSATPDPAEPAGASGPADPALMPGRADRTGRTPTGLAPNADAAPAMTAAAGGPPGSSRALSGETGSSSGDTGTPGDDSDAPAPGVPPVGTPPAGTPSAGPDQGGSPWSQGSLWPQASPGAAIAAIASQGRAGGVASGRDLPPVALSLEKGMAPSESALAPSGMLTGTTPAAAAFGATTPSPTAPAGPPVSPYDLASQVAKHLTGLRTLSDGTHRTVLHLAPEHLGELTLTVDVRAGTVALAVAGQDAALAGLRDGLAQLRTALAEAGLDLGDVSMSAPDRTPDRAPERDGGQNPAADRQNGNRDQPHQSHRGGHDRSAGERSPSGDQDPGRPARPAAHQRIDITV